MATNPALFKVTSEHSLSTLGDRLPEVAKQYKFGVLGMHNLKEKMAAKGVQFDKEVRVFDICNPQQAKEVLTEALEVSTVLPCRISAYEEGGKRVMAMVRPTRLMTIFDVSGMEETARQVEETLITIMRETAGA